MKKELNNEMLEKVNGGENMKEVIDSIIGDHNFIPDDIPVLPEIHDLKIIDREAIEKALKELYKDVKLEPVYANNAE